MAINIIKSKPKTLESFRDKIVEIVDLLIYSTETDCSDLYIKVGERPFISRFGKIIEIPCVPTTNIEWENFEKYYISSELHAGYVREKNLDSAVKILIPEDSPMFGKYEGMYFRYRANYGFSENRNIVTFRMIKPKLPSFKHINFDNRVVDVLRESYKNKSGITIFSGPTGSGKSTTLAACMNDFTQPGEILDNKIIVTLEDPIEMIYKNTKNVRFTQKELGIDFKSYLMGIKQALREHPNMINVGECRDKEVIQSTIEACRTGHYVTTSFHASDVAGTISRMSFYLGSPDMIYDLIINMNLIVSQRIEPAEDKYVVKTQYMLFNEEITKRILDIISKGKNITVEINEMFKDEKLIKDRLVKDWS